jgi:class 3 adenylate cyclase/tetratricopeptide (TPR) repeat protein
MGGFAEMPEGPVTIMFTDVEGSTVLRTTVGDQAADEILALHDALVRAEIEAHKGHDQEAALGDGFLAVFASPRRAVACAIGIQKALDTFNRSRAGVSLKVRIGLNTGEVAWQDGQPSGEAVHAAARVCAAGEGGQIFVSDVTRQLAGTIPDVTFRDAGEYELKGFPQPWRLYDVVWVRETSALPEQVFVGREAELAQLRERLLSALDGHGGFVLVGGEPGVGKTALVKQLIREAEQRGALAVFGRCYESDGTVPYSPFVEMLEQALDIMPPDIVREDMGDDAPEVARLVPELRRRFPDIGEPLDLPPEQQRRYFFNAVGAFVARGSTRFPLLLVMDDVHWADEPTLLLIEHMAELMPELRVLGVGTYRDVELEVSRPLAAAMERLVRARLVDRVAVKRFDRSTVETMIGALAGKPPPAAVVDAVFTETEGNPFFVEEVFRHLAEEGKLFTDGEFRTDIEVDELDVPESVRLVVGRRLERLGDEAQKVLGAGAVVGRAFPFRLLEAITDVEAGRLLDVVEEAEAARVIVGEERDGEVHYSFAHELIRQTLLAGLSVLRRQRLHLAVADAIEQTDKRARQERPSEVANHLLQAGAAADTERTLEYLELTAQRAFAAAAFEEAVRAIDDALSVVDPDDRLRVAQLQERRGWAVRALGHFDECLAIWDGVVTAYAELGRIDEAAALSWEMGYQLIWQNRFEAAFDGYARGLAIVGDRRTASRALLVSGTGVLLGLAGGIDDAERSFDEAAAIAREVGDERVLGRVEWTRSVSYWFNGRSSEAIASGRDAIDRLRRANDPWGLVDALCWTAFPLLFVGDHRAAQVLFAESIELGRKVGQHAGETLGLRGAAICQLFSAADLDAMERGATVDLERFEGSGSPWAGQSHAWIAAVRILRGDLDAAGRAAERAIALEPDSAFAGIGWCFEFLSVAYAQDADACRRLLQDERHDLPAPGERAPAGRTFKMFAAAHGSAVAGLADEADELYPLVAERLEEFVVGALFDVQLAQRIAGMAAAAAGRWDDAVRHFDIALDQAGSLPLPLEQPQVEHWYGKMLLDRGDPADAARGRELLGSAIARYAEIGMPLHAAMARSALDAPS